MAALALRPSAASTLLAQLHSGLQSLLQGPSSLLDLLPPIILAVPKSKVSHSRKSMRAANKGLTEKLNIVTCPGCGRAKRSHHICPVCYSDITRGFKTAAKQQTKHTSLPPHPSTSEISLENTRWAEQRGGAIPKKEGDVLTKWMRARAGYRKNDPQVRLGSETVDKQRSERTNRREEDDDEPPVPPSGMQFA